VWSLEDGLGDTVAAGEILTVYAVKVARRCQLLVEHRSQAT